ncbi:MAG TPA: cyclopropane-fatty-acyl-phospholipid synthase family protein [Rhizomicrobium sp.]|nr:cyclopropane-fatty-acyl-phospholipid synthase family protein [Rhizomicrobium sp.]
MLGLLLNRLMRKGTLTVIHADGRQESFGSGAPHVTIRFHDRRAIYELLLNPDLVLGELYMNGRLTVENGGTIRDALDLLMMNLGMTHPTGLHKLVRSFRRYTRRFAQFNPAKKSKEHVAHHYDLDGRLYDLFLDRDKQYSCAYFSAPGETLEQAQIGKKRHIAAKLHIDKPGLKVLDIGCGWGGLALDLARDTRAKVLGVTLSEEQIAVAKDRAAKARLEDSCRFELVDYRALGGKYDRIVSVGMFEHVGAPYYDAFFAKVRDLLADDGAMLLHTIGRTDGPGSTNAWIAKYIFPGGYVPALSELSAAIEKSGLMITDVEVLRLHYAETLLEWQKRFQANRARAAEIYDERFCRMWEFYLAGAEMAFRHDGQVVFQVQIAKKVDALPITRDYMLEDERTMRFAGTEEMPKPLRVV